MGLALRGTRVLVTGACGTIGSALVSRLLSDSTLGVAEVIGVDNNESGLFLLEQECAYTNGASSQFHLADIRDLQRLKELMGGIDYLFHAAAYKHVVMCEKAPFDAVRTNIVGTQNIITAAIESGVKRVIFTSSDKAVNPTNVMGTSKLMGERLVTAASIGKAPGLPVFASTRFGNVLGSNGSVLPIFRRQILERRPITLTHRDMTRFVMSVEQAVDLVLESAGLARGGEVFITKMPVIRISDLATVMVAHLAPKHQIDPASIKIEEIGVKPGEKLYEELMSDEERTRSLELSNYFVVLPAFRGLYSGVEYSYENVVRSTVDRAYVSDTEKPLSQANLLRFLEQYKLI